MATKITDDVRKELSDLAACLGNARDIAGRIQGHLGLDNVRDAKGIRFRDKIGVPFGDVAADAGEIERVLRSYLSRQTRESPEPQAELLDEIWYAAIIANGNKYPHGNDATEAAKRLATLHTRLLREFAELKSRPQKERRLRELSQSDPELQEFLLVRGLKTVEQALSGISF